MMISMTVKVRVATVLVLAVVIAGCNVDPTKGYTLSDQYRKGIRTVAVNVFTRGTNVYRRDIEMRLTEAIVKHIELNTPYKVTSKARADTQLTGTIERISQRAMSFNPDTGSARELEIILNVSMEWTDLRSGKIILKADGLRAAGMYIPPNPMAEDFFQGSTEAVNRLAARIVEKMEADW